MSNEVRNILELVKSGDMTVDDALLGLKIKPYEDIDYAKVDLHRKVVQGTSEVIYGAGKTAEQIMGILDVMMRNGQDRILVTRLSEEKAEVLRGKFAVEYDPVSKVGRVGDFPPVDGIGTILIATAGTSDIPVAEEAAITAEMLGNRIERAYDMGVAGLHRTFGNIESIMNASVIVAIAGMEGALASVLGGLADCPVIAVPTSVGYGASFGGLTALLSMLNSCASGVSVVNIDNGFGAGYLASMINHMEVKQ